MLLKSIQQPQDVKSLDESQLIQLSGELRNYIIETILESGGHFAGNLGVVELTVALHKILNFEIDSLIWDVGHQSYAHKCLTGRLQDLPSIRSFGNISGFPKRDENPFDFFGTGHSSTSISAAMGISAAAENPNSVQVAIIGDGALTAGLSYEALNNLWESQLNVLVILNDNNMGIDPNTGALNAHLQEKNNQAIQSFIEFFGVQYRGPVDGHNLPLLLKEINDLYKIRGPRLLHVKTTKGKGYIPAEQQQTKWHSASKFVKVEGVSFEDKKTSIKWQDVFSDALTRICNNKDTIAITPAMPSSCGMIDALEKYPTRVYDVGIAEQHALTFAAGFATSGKTPIVNIYSSFLQRAYDQWIHDIALQKLPVVLCIDRAGLVGEDGPTHHGAFDISFLRCIPNTWLLAPHTGIHLFTQLHWAIQQGKPIAIRYPKGNIPDVDEYLQFRDSFDPEKISTYSPFPSEWIHPSDNKNILLLTTGWATQIAKMGNQRTNIAHIHLHQLHSGTAHDTLEILAQFKHIITVEDGTTAGGWGMGIIQELQHFNWKGSYENLGIPAAFIPHGSNNTLYEYCGYSPEQIEAKINLINR